MVFRIPSFRQRNKENTNMAGINEQAQIMSAIEKRFIDLVTESDYPNDQADADEMVAAFIADVERTYPVKLNGTFDHATATLDLKVRRDTELPLGSMTARVEHPNAKPTSMDDLQAAIAPKRPTMGEPQPSQMDDVREQSVDGVRTHTAASIRKEAILEVAKYLAAQGDRRKRSASMLCMIGQHTDETAVRGMGFMYEAISHEIVDHFEAKS